MARSQTTPEINPANAPKWAQGFALLLTCLVGALLASEGIIDKVMNRDSLRDQLGQSQAKLDAATKQIENLDSEMDALRLEVSRTRQESIVDGARFAAQMEAKDAIIADLRTREAQLTKRVTTLETTLAELTDRKHDTITKKQP